MLALLLDCDYSAYVLIEPRPLSSETNDDGRCPTLLPSNHQIEKGIYRVTFETKKYFESQGQACFYPYVQVRNAREAKKVALHPRSWEPLGTKKWSWLTEHIFFTKKISLLDCI